MYQPDADLPGVPRALARSIQLAYRAAPLLLVASFGVSVGAAIPDALTALWLKLLADGVQSGRGRSVAMAAAGLAASAVLGWFLNTVGGRVNMRFRDRATVEVEAHVARLQATVPGVEHHERPQYLDRLQLLRDQVFLLNHLWGSFFGTLGSLARLGFTIALLVTVHPGLALLALAAVPTVLSSSRRAGVERAVTERNAPYKRLSRHLFELGTSAGPGKEVRVGRIGDRLIERQRAARDAWLGDVARARNVSAAWHAAAWTLFGAAYVGAIAFVSVGMRASAGDVLLVLAAGGRLAQFIATTVGGADFLRWTIDATQRLCWLEDYARDTAERDPLDPPSRLARGIGLEHVSFRYPGTDHWVLRDVDLDLPAGSVVAVVGENGAGKTTLVKLLAKMYEPDEGRVTVDGVDLSRIAAAPWRARLAGAFQDFARFEFLARKSVGLGDPPRMDERDAVLAGVGRGGAGDVVDRLPHGIDTQLGPTWHEGVELSFGQWQKLALARGFMRDDPLLIVLDEPTAALDAETEHALFERFASAARSGQNEGRITVLVSHRFSTVRMADLIVVLDGARVVETGSHDELAARGGLYAELYGIQARAYR